MIDIVIVGDINSPITDRCVDSLKEESTVIDHANIFIEPYVGYNKSLNNGAKKGKQKYIAFCNNDIQFTKGWDIDILEALKSDIVVSASAWCPLTHHQWWGNEVPLGNIIGTQTGKIVTGWFLMLKRKWWVGMGGFDERLEFFCCDNSYTIQLERAGKKHVLVVGVEIKHYQSSTLNQFKGTAKYDELTMGQVKVFNRLYNQNLFNAGT